MKRKTHRRTPVRSIESLEVRQVLAAPMAADDTFNILEDSQLAGAGGAITSNFDQSPTQIFAGGGTWSYLDRITNGEGGTPQLTYPVDEDGNAWYDVNFDLGSSSVGPWASGPGAFAGGPINAFVAPNPTAATTLQGITGGGAANTVTTYLFRRTFDMTAAALSETIGEVRTLCDDGCIGYVNGTEAFRLNMAPGAVTTQQEALNSTATEDAYSNIGFSLTGLGLSPLGNVLAVEVHQSGVTGQQVSSDIGFDLGFSTGSGADGYAYADDVLGTSPNRAAWANGEHRPQDGFNGTGALRVQVNCIQFCGFGGGGSSSGAWTKSFSVGSATNATVTLRYRLILGNDSDPGEFSQAVLMVDGTRYGVAAAAGRPTPVLAEFVGDGNGGANNDTGWQTASFSIPLTAGNHTITLGGFISASGGATEFTQALFDDVVIDGVGGAQEGADLVANDTVDVGLTATATVVTPPAHGTITNFDPTGKVFYRPNANYNGTDSFTYRLNDGTANSNVATVNINITPVNDAPAAVADTYTMIANGTLATTPSSGVLANDTDVDNATLTAGSYQITTTGTFLGRPDGSFTFTPVPGFTGQQTFTYVTSDGQLTSSATTVTINVIAGNNPPSAGNDDYSVISGLPLTIVNPLAPAPILAYANDFSGDSPTVVSGATAVLSGITTTEAVQNFNNLGAGLNRFGNSFLRNTSNNTGADPATPTTIVIDNVPAHNRIDISFLLALIDSWDGATGNGSPDIFNVTLDGVPLFSEMFQTSNALDGTYSAPPGVLLADGIQLGFGQQGFQASNVDSAYNMGMESAFQDIPHTSDTITLSFFASGAGWNGGNEESWAIDNLSITLRNFVEPQFTVMNYGGAWKYLANGSNQGTAWRAPGFNDTAWSSGAAELGYGDAAEGRPEATTIPFGPDPNNKPITTYFRRTFSVANLAEIASLTLNLLRDDGVAVYLNGVEVLRDNLSPAAAFDRIASQPISGAAETNVVSRAVSPALLVPGLNTLAVEIHQASADSDDLSFNLQLIASRANAFGVLSNDTDPDRNPLTTQVVVQPAHGTVTLNPNGTFTYRSANGYVGPDAFIYVASDGQATSNPATVSLTVLPGPDIAPVANHDEYTVAEGELLSIAAALGLLANDTDAESNPLTALLVSPPQHGTLSLSPSGGFTYLPDDDYNGDDTFVYVANDAARDSEPAIVTIHVTPQPDVPVARDDAYFVGRGATLGVSAVSGVLANDTDADGDALTALLVSPAANGVATLLPNGSFTYQPNPGFTGSDSFTYRSRDAGGRLSDVATVSIHINTPPQTAADSYTVNEDGTLTVAAAQGVLANDTDSDQEPFTAVLITSVAHGTLSLSASGAFIYTPTANYFGSDSFTYRADDGQQRSGLATVSITVNAQNDAPVGAADSYTAFQNATFDVPVARGVLANDIDIDSPGFTAELVNTTVNGTLVFNANGSFSYTPATDYAGQDSFTYRASDGTLTSTVQTVTLVVAPASQLITINEINYHPAEINSVEPSGEEFIELHNQSTGPILLTGWKFTQGVDFTFPAVSIPGGGYLIIASNVAAFTARYPGVTGVIGGWTGNLSNSGEDLELVDDRGARVDRVDFADEGDWGTRILAAADQGTRGWEWIALHDGGGRSLELVNSAVKNNQGQNWLASTINGGTPGAANTVLATDTAPLIENIQHSPAVPRSTDSVTITAELTDDVAAGMTAVLSYRVATASPGQFLTEPMLDDGLHGDGAAGDGVFGAILPPRDNGTIIEFFVTSSDTTGHSRSAPVYSSDQANRTANFLYQVDNEVYSGAQPVYRFVATPIEQGLFAGIDRDSNARMNATFIATLGADSDVRYNSSYRIRGESSRQRNPTNLKLNIPSDNPWNRTTEANLNSQYTWLQTLGGVLSQLAGVAAYDVRPIQIRLNGANIAVNTDVEFGSFVHVEPFGQEYLDNHLPNDATGNLYKKVRPDNKWPVQARLGNGAVDIAAYQEDGWSKNTNASVNDWNDLDNFLRVMNSASGATYLQQVDAVADLDQWATFFAITALINHRETNISNGVDDDYDMYHAANGMQLLPHDYDTIFGLGDTQSAPNATIFQAPEAFAGQGTVQPLVTLFRDPTFVRMYYSELRRLLDSVYSETQFNATVDNLLVGWVPQSSIDQVKSFAAQRRAYVESQLPKNLTATTTAAVQSGFPRITTATGASVNGAFNPLTTASIKVGGIDATLDAYARTYSTSAGGTGTPVTLVARGATGAVWRFLDNGTDQGTAWREPTFDDSTWRSGPGELGYGDGGETTVVNCGPSATQCNAGNFATTYFRHTFNVTNAAQYASLQAIARFDDGIAIYLNGQEIARDNLAPGALFSDFALANGQDNDATFTTFNIAGSGALREGSNTLAVEVHQTTAISSDISFHMDLIGVIPPAGGGSLTLTPGVNRLLVQAFDSNQQEVERRTIDIWFDDTTETAVPSSTISTNTTWRAADGPYHVTGNVTIAPGATLTIEPGTTVVFDAGFGLIVNGRLSAVGTELQHIRLRSPIGSTTTWAGIRFANTTEDNILSYVDMENGDSRGDSIESRFSALTLDHMTWVSASAQILDMDDSSFHVKNSVFPGISGGTDGELIHGNRILATGRAIIENNVFGVTNGYNDVIDFTGGQRPGPILQILKNVFTGGSDDALDFDGTDAHVEGNIFKNFHKNNTSDSTSNAIATGLDGGNPSELTIVRNFFYNNDHAVLVKEGSAIVFQHNTVVNSSISAINFDEPERNNVQPGLGAVIEDSIFDQTTPTFENVYTNHPTEGTTQLTVNRSLVGGAFIDRGAGNLNASLGARIVSPATDDFRLGPGSAAKGTGSYGYDMGAAVPSGALLAGVPASVTASNSATIQVAGAGLTAYRFRMDGGAFSGDLTLATPILLTALANGPHTIEVVGINSAGVMQSPPTAMTWTVDPTMSRVRINEVLAINSTAVAHGEAFPDLIELYNAGGQSVNLSGWSISDELDTPGKFVFPAGTTIAPGQHLVLFADSRTAAGELHLGFSLQGDGDDLTLYNNDAPTRHVVDQIVYGTQLANQSIGVLADGTWGLTQPTLGAANVSQRTGDTSRVRINEWLVSQDRLYRDDRLELFNPDPLPVNVGGMYLTDNPVGNPTKHQITPLTFIAGSGYGVFVPDENSTAGASHLNFRLSGEFELLGLMTSGQKVQDQLYYVSQRPDVSQGRTTDGAPLYTTFFPPNIGSTNSTGQQGVVTLIAANSTWKYDASGTDLGTGWRAAAYNDTAWATGAGGLGFSASLPAGVLGTILPGGQQTYYFRRTFQVTDPANVELTLRHRFDDGAVVYINGQEVLRAGMPAGAVSYGTVPTRSVTDATAFEGPITLPIDALVAGDNVIAVEVHNILATDPDLLMSLELLSSSSPQVIRLLDGLRVTEVMYNSAEPGDETEFVELQNIGPTTLDLTGVQLLGAVDFVFPAITLAPNQYVVVVRDLTAFRAAYGAGPNVAGVYTNRLDNSGEEIDLALPEPFEHNIQDFTYSDNWYPATDGLGPSIVIRNARSTDPRSWDQQGAWRQSGSPNGSPGTDDPLDATPPRVAQVLVGSTNWTTAYLTELDNRNFGDGGYSVGTVGAPIPVAWTNLNQITLVFDDNVIVSQGDLTIRGVNQATYLPVGFDTVANRATWTFAAPFGAERVRLELSNNIRDVVGNVLTNSPTYAIAIVPGDIDHNGVTNSADRIALQTSGMFDAPGGAGFDPLRDIDGNGKIGIRDLVQVRNRAGTTLPPTGSPSVPQAAVAALVDNSHSDTSSVGTTDRPSSAATRRTLRASVVDRFAERLAAVNVPTTLQALRTQRPTARIRKVDATIADSVFGEG